MGTYSDGTTKSLTSPVTWSSSNSSVATIASSGLVTAKAVGSTTITATSSSYTASAVLTVTSSSSGTDGCDGGGNCYIFAGATGAGSGANWTNAYTGFGTGKGQVAPSAMERGVTYWIAAGSYGPQTFSTPDDGTTVVTIESATTANHGPASDWSDAYAGVATFAGGTTNFASDYWSVNGQTRGADWQSGYTIRFDLNGVDSKSGVITNVNLAQTAATTNLTFKYVEVRGSNMNYTIATGATDGCGHYCDAGYLTSSGTNDFYVGYSWIHDVGDTQFQSNSNTNSQGTNTNGTGWIIEYNYISRNHTGDQSGTHAEAFSLTAQNVIVRYNYFQDIGSSGVITDASAGTPDVGPWYIYGNIVFWTNNNGGPGIGDGFVVLLGETMHGTSYVVGNTMANINNAYCELQGTACSLILVYDVGSGEAGTPTIYIENNLLWNISAGGCYLTAVSGWTFIADYNTTYDSPGYYTCGSHMQTVNTTTPFVNWNGSGTTIVPYESLNFQLVTDTSAGNNAFSGIPAGCIAGVNCANVSFNGLVYGASGVYDRGAMQLPAK
jgi:hypothetical protein